jgi:hypothetical protein
MRPLKQHNKKNGKGFGPCRTAIRKWFEHGYNWISPDLEHEEAKNEDLFFFASSCFCFVKRLCNSRTLAVRRPSGDQSPCTVHR